MDIKTLQGAKKNGLPLWADRPCRLYGNIFLCAGIWGWAEENGTVRFFSINPVPVLLPVPFNGI